MAFILAFFRIMLMLFFFVIDKKLKAKNPRQILAMQSVKRRELLKFP